MAQGHLDELQKAEVVNTSKLVPSVIIKTHYVVVIDRFHFINELPGPLVSSRCRGRLKPKYAAVGTGSTEEYY